MAPSILAASSPFLLHGAAGTSSRRALPAGAGRRAASALRVNTLKYDPSKIKSLGADYFVTYPNCSHLQKSAGGVLLPKSAVKFERYLMAGADVSEVEAGKKVLFSDINAYEVDLGTNEKHCFCRESDLLAVVE
ncbi:hypothetical protein ABZP36_030102 [Zizania latifolia]